MADEPINQQPQITPNEAMKIVFLAKQAGNGKLFLLFQKQLADEHVPWSLTDERFLQKAEELRAALITELGLQNEAVVKKAAEESFSRTLSQEEREGMELGFANIQKQEQVHQKNIFNHTESLVNTYIGQLKTQGIDVTNEQKSALHKSAIQTIKQGGAADLSKNIATTAASLGIPETTSSAAATSLKLPDDSQKDMQQIARYSKITEIVLTGEDDIQKGTLVQQCLADTETPPEIVAEKYKGSLQIEKAFSLPDDIKQEVDVVLQNPVDRKIAFTQAAESIQKGVSQPIGDVITAIGGPQGKDFLDKAIDEVLGGSGGPKVGTPRVSFEIPWGTKSPTTNQGIEGLLKELKEKGTLDGKEIKKIALVEAKIKALEQSLIERRAARNAPRTFVNNTVVTSAANILAPQIKEGLMVYLEAATTRVHANAPECFHYVVLAGTDVWNSIVGRATKKVTGAAVEKLLGGAVKKGAQAAVGKAATSTAAATIGATMGPLGAALGLIGKEVLGKIGSFVFGGIKSLFSAVQLGDIARGITDAFGAQKQKPQKQMDWGLWLAIILVAFIPIIFLDSSLISLAAMTTVPYKEKTDGEPNANEAENGQSNNDGGGEGVVVEIPDTPNQQFSFVQCDPKSEDDCKWPVNDCHDRNGKSIKCCVTQGPYGQGDSSTHKLVSAIDIDGNLGDPITALAGGTIVGVIKNYTNSFVGEGYTPTIYGNYVDVKETWVIDGIQRTMIRRYAHLAAVPETLAYGSTISAGDSIGVMGSSGVNYSNYHLHLEARRVSGDPNSIANVNIGLPTSVPECSYGECPIICWD